MKKFDFLGQKYYWFSISLLIVILGITAFFLKGVQFGIEFKGGTAFDVVFKKGDYTVEDVRKVLKDIGYGDSIIKKIENTKGEFLVRTVSVSRDEEQKIINTLDKELRMKELKSVKSVTPTWGADITRSALISLVFALILILLYVSIRLDFKMAVTSVVTLLHDVMITISIYILVGREITPATVAAVLTLLGYSLYDTIVIFHRIMENSRQIGKRTFQTMANDSIHQILMRWVNTLITTLIPIIGIFFFGGETLKDFAFALLIGVASGGYSSIFIAAPIYVIWKEREPYFANLRKKYGNVAA